jgi:formate hydrogenlyase subunit 6/NADH:ubiquinone oxidoreductase subunit I
MRLLSMALRRGLSTIDWPREVLATEGPARGVPEFDRASCTACGDCLPSCPARCLILEKDSPYPVVDAGACVRCGRCVVACGEESISLDGSGDLAAYSRQDLVLDGTPAEEREVGPTPSRIYRRTVVSGGGARVEPRRLLEERASALLGRKGQG